MKRLALITSLILLLQTGSCYPVRGQTAGGAHTAGGTPLTPPRQPSTNAAPSSQLAPAQNALPLPVSYHRWVDPQQGAFSLMVPDGWKVIGGMFQPSALDVRPAINIVSPDGSVILFMGDNSLPSFAMPTPVLSMTGFRIGSTYSPGGGLNLIVEPYQRAPQFLQTYGPTRLGRTCQHVVTDSIQDQPLLAATTKTIYDQAPTPGVRSEFSMADGHFHCLRNGQPYTAYLILAVQAGFGVNTGMGTWLIPHLWGYVSPPAHEAEAGHVLQMVMTTLKLDPQWVARTNNNNANVVRVAEETTQAMMRAVNAACAARDAAVSKFLQTQRETSDIVMQGYENRLASEGRISAKRSNAILGINTVEDPGTGERHTVDNSYSYYWKAPSGSIVGTQTYGSPGAGYTQMNIVP